MPKRTLADLARVLGAKIVNTATPEAVLVRDYSNDTRKISSGSAYIALIGENHDGHAFVADAAEAGAACAIVQSEGALAGLTLPALIVNDTLLAMGAIARSMREEATKIDWIGVAGSNGKTTTREMIASLIASRGPTLKNDGNHNNQIGVPQTIFRIGREHRQAVIELGTSEPGEIERLTQIVKPSIGVLTNIAEEHLEGLIDLEGVFEEEVELFRGMDAKSVAVVNYDDPLSVRAQHAAKGRVVGYGFDRRADIRASEVIVTAQGTSFRVNERYAFTLNMIGRHNVSNALAAIAVGWVLGVPLEAMQTALAAFQPVAMRSDFERIGRLNLINDCYNANPGSMRAAIQTLSDFRAKKRRIAVLGDMLELGDAAHKAHWLMGWWIAHRQVDHVVAVGPMMEILAARLVELDIPCTICDTSTDAAELVAKMAKAEDTVLVKGSRGMRMEMVSEALRERFSKRRLLRR